MGISDSVLLHEPVVAVQPTLVRRLGSMADAAVLQQLHYRALRKDAWEDEDGELWAPARYADLARETGLSADQARRSIEHLEQSGVVLSCQPEHFNRRKSYRLDYAHEVFAPAESAARSGTSASSEGGTPARSSTSQREETPSGAAPLPDGEAAKPAKERPRNLVFDALAEVYPPTTKSEQSLTGSVAAELRALQPPPAPELVLRVARWVKHEFPTSTVRAVATHWTRGLNASRRSASQGASVMTSCRACGELPVDCRCAGGPT